MSPAEAPELSLVVPTYNEAENLPILAERLGRALAGIRHEVIVADDDSPDRTWEVAGRLGLRCIRRTRDRGLYPAVMEGFAAARGRVLGLIDADLQHDEAALPAMLEQLRRRGLALVAATRYARGGGVQDWSRRRLWISRTANAAAGLVLRARVSDPMSGFFLIERRTYQAVLPGLRPRGFKVLFDILANLPPGAEVGEVGYVFRPRRAGASKLDGRVALQFVQAFFEALAGRLRGR